MKPRKLRRVKSKVWNEPPAKRAGQEAQTFLRKAARVHEANALSDEQIDLILAQAIVDAVTDRGSVVEADLKRANVPAGAITPTRYLRCLALARELCPSLDGRAFRAA